MNKDSDSFCLGVEMSVNAGSTPEILESHWLNSSVVSVHWYQVSLNKVLQYPSKVVPEQGGTCATWVAAEAGARLLRAKTSRRLAPGQTDTARAVAPTCRARFCTLAVAPRAVRPPAACGDGQSGSHSHFFQLYAADVGIHIALR